MPLKIDHTGFYIKTYLIKTSVKIQGQNSFSAPAKIFGDPATDLAHNILKNC